MHSFMTPSQLFRLNYCTYSHDLTNASACLSCFPVTLSVEWCKVLLMRWHSWKTEPSATCEKQAVVFLWVNTCTGHRVKEIVTGGWQCRKCISFGSGWVSMACNEGSSLLWPPVLQCKVPCGGYQECFYLCEIFLHVLSLRKCENRKHI